MGVKYIRCKPFQKGYAYGSSYVSECLLWVGWLCSILSFELTSLTSVYEAKQPLRQVSVCVWGVPDGLVPALEFYLWFQPKRRLTTKTVPKPKLFLFWLKGQPWHTPKIRGFKPHWPVMDANLKHDGD